MATTYLRFLWLHGFVVFILHWIIGNSSYYMGGEPFECNCHQNSHGN